jgi:hypothetical protein
VVRVDGEAEPGASLLGEPVEHGVRHLRQPPAFLADEVPVHGGGQVIRGRTVPEV